MKIQYFLFILLIVSQCFGQEITAKIFCQYASAAGLTTSQPDYCYACIDSVPTPQCKQNNWHAHEGTNEDVIVFKGGDNNHHCACPYSCANDHGQRKCNWSGACRDQGVNSCTTVRGSANSPYDTVRAMFPIIVPKVSSLVDYDELVQASIQSAVVHLGLQQKFFATTTTYTITVTNLSPNPQNFFFFQQPAVYTGGAQVYSNSLGYQPMNGYNPSTPQQIQFTFIQQYRAGAQLQTTPPQVGVAQTSLISQSLVQVSTGTNDKSSQDTTVMTIDQNNNPVLSAATNTQGVQGGAFRIVTPVFQPASGTYLIGLGGVSGGYLVLSNFITAPPNSFVDVQPVVKFYIATGSYSAGQTINFSVSSAESALCDATNGKLNFLVNYNADGTWSVQ